MAIKLRFYKTHPETPTPVYSTTDAACFDIFLCTHGKMGFDGYDDTGKKFLRLFTNTGGLTLCPRDRVLAPTGLIFDIPKDYSIRIHPRSGLSLKEGLTLANAEGVIDSDYMEETYVMLTNVSTKNIVVPNLTRICQGELVRNNRATFEEIKEKPIRENTNRKGGFGSTGTKPLEISQTNTI